MGTKYHVVGAQVAFGQVGNFFHLLTHLTAIATMEGDHQVIRPARLTGSKRTLAHQGQGGDRLPHLIDRPILNIPYTDATGPITATTTVGNPGHPQYSA